jgi:hypothetical protein
MKIHHFTCRDKEFFNQMYPPPFTIGAQTRSNDRTDAKACCRKCHKAKKLRSPMEFRVYLGKPPRCLKVKNLRTNNEEDCSNNAVVSE